MTDPFSISLSGMVAQQTKLAATANNIANVETTGAVPSANPAAPASTVYKPLQVNFQSIAVDGNGQGVSAQVTADPKGYSLAYSPNSPYANAQGMIATPNVDLTTESVNLIMTKIAYKANIAAFKTSDEMTKQLLDTIA